MVPVSTIPRRFRQPVNFRPKLIVIPIGTLKGVVPAKHQGRAGLTNYGTTFPIYVPQFASVVRGPPGIYSVANQAFPLSSVVAAESGSVPVFARSTLLVPLDSRVTYAALG